MISKHLKDIKKLLKAYHKKFDAFGNRRKEILDKMLDYEKAEKQKEMDEQRQSNEAKSQEQSNPNGFLEYNKQKQKEEELLRTLPPAMSPFYKNKVNTYFNGVELNKQPKE